MGLPANVEEVRETLRKIQKNLECPICLELLSDPYTTQCSHPFCRMCIYTVISSTREAKCPLCKEPISKRSMNENNRLAEIVEAVKELEQAIVKDSGIPRTPPRPLPPHSHEATGTPGVIVHSLLHPTPQKPRNTLSKESVAVRASQNGDSSNETRPLVAATCTSNRQAHHSCSPRQNVSTVKHRKSVRFATTKPTRRKRKIPRVASSASSQAALLQALEEVNFAEPGATLNSTAMDLKSNPVEGLKPQSMLGVHERGNTSEEEKRQQIGAEGASAVGEEAVLSSPVRKKPRREEPQRQRETFGSSQNISRVLETPAVVGAIKVDCLEPSTCTPTNNSTSRHNQDSDVSEGTATSQPKRIAETPWLVPGGNVGIEPQKDASQHEMAHDQQGTAPALNPSQNRQESDVTVLAEETQSIEPPTSIPTHSVADNTPCTVGETQIMSAHSQATSQGVIVASQGEISPASAARADKQNSPRVCCVGETQLENQAHNKRGWSSPSSCSKSTVSDQQDRDFAGNRSCVSEGDTTPSLSPPSFAASHTTPSHSLGHKSADLNSTLHTVDKVQSKELQNNTQTSPLIQASTPIHSSPKCAEVPIVPPLFASPPLTPSSPSVLNHSISPSIPMQNTYTSGAASSRGNLTQDKTMIPDTYGAVRPDGASRVDETQLESIPSTQQSPVALLLRSHTLPGLHKTLGGQRYNLQPSLSQSSRGSQKYNMPAKSTLEATQQSQSVPSLAAVSPQPTRSQRKPDGNSYPPPSPPGSLTVVPDSLLPHTQCHSTSSAHNDSPPKETASLTGEPSTSSASEGGSAGILSPDRDTQWDVRSSAFTQELTSQELEALRREMEEKEQEILELEALLQQDTKGHSAGKHPESSSSPSRIPDSLDVIHTPPTVTCNRDHQSESSQSPSVKNETNSCSSSADTHSQVSLKTGPLSPEITVVVDTVPDSFPPASFPGNSHENICTLHLQPSSKKTKLECEVPPSQVSRTGMCISRRPATQISTSTGSHSPSRTKPLVQKKVDTLLQQPLTQTKTAHSPYTHQQYAKTTPLSGQKGRKKNQRYGKTSPSWPKKPSPMASNNEANVLEMASKLIKALRSPPQVVLESQTTLEVDKGLYETPTSARSSTTPQAKYKNSAKRTKTTKGHSPMSASGKQKATSQGKPAKKKRPLVVLDSQDLERYSPPPINDPLPFNHPFMSITTSPHQQSLLHKQQTVHHHPLEEKSKCITSPPASIMETPHVQLSASVLPGESPTYGVGLCHHTVPPSFLASGLTKAQLSQAQILVKKYGGRIASCFNGSTTHIIVQADENGCCPRTVKYLQGVAAGKWIVGYNWVRDSLEAGLLLPEAGYEVRGDQVYSVNAPSKAHKCRSTEPGLFHRWSFYLAGQFQGISQDHLAQLIQLADGTIMQTFPTEMDSGILIYDGEDTSAWLHRKEVTVLTSSWVLDSLSQYFLLPAEKYQH